MGAEKFCLRWNDFETNLSTAFRDLRTDKDLFDVTLSCGADTLQAHKLVLSACSDLFRGMFKKSLPVVGGHAILYLRGVQAADMQAVLDFMYHGEVSVAQEELNSFLAVAEELKVKGLTQKQGQGSTENNHGSKASEYPDRKVTENNYPSHADPKSTKLEYSASAPPKKPRPPKPSQARLEPEIEELVPIKTEPIAAPAYQQHQVATMEHVEDTGMTGHAVDTYDGYSGYEDDNYQYQEQGHYSDVQSLDNSRGNAGSNVDLQDYISKVSNDYGTMFSCTLCGKQNNQKGNLMKHVESVHFPNSFSHQCKYCNQTFYAKNNLYVHVSKFHKNK